MTILSISLILLCGFALGGIAQKMKLPALVGMMAAGILLGSSSLNLITDEILQVSFDLRSIALVIILLRAGIALDLKDIKKLGISSMLICIIPPLAEIAAVIVTAPPVFGISTTEAAILGAVLCAVSPAVVVPRMLRLIEKKLGTAQNIPQMMLAATSINGIFAVVLFGIFMGVYESGEFNTVKLLNIPISVISGIALGGIVGLLTKRLIKNLLIRNTVKVFIILGIALFLMTVETLAKPYIALSGLLAVVTFGIVFGNKNHKISGEIYEGLSKLWVVGELVLFVMLGTSVNVGYAARAFTSALLVIVSALCIRLCMVFLCLSGSKLSKKERVFCALAYVPKATVQAAIGGVPLAEGVASGEIILAVATVSILVLAPVGAGLVDYSEDKLLLRDG